VRVAVLAACGVSVSVGPLLAHGATAHDWSGPGAFSAWDIAVIAGLLLTGFLYVRGSQRMAERGAVHRLRERFAFASGWSVLLISILPPLDSLAVEQFSVHMVQHELMMLIGAPLLMAGRPLTACLWGLGRSARGASAGALQRPMVSTAWRWLTTPVVAWTLHGLVIWLWHLPSLYGAAVSHEGIHAVQHATFVGSAVLFWWGLLYGRYGRAGYGAAVFFVFTTAIHTGILGAMLTFASGPLYPIYSAPAARRGIDMLGDQQIAGLLMWIPAGVVLTLTGLALFAAWIGESARRDQARFTE
jgi:putative membrane protein